MGDIAGYFAPGNGCSDVTGESLLNLTNFSLSPTLQEPKFVLKKKKNP